MIDMQALQLRYGGFRKYNWSDVQWIVHPEHWFLARPLDQSGIWRVAYGECDGVGDLELRGRLSENLETLLPGAPKESDYEIITWSPFFMHQRCAEKMRQGRVLLAGDAGHLCSPMHVNQAIIVALSPMDMLTSLLGVVCVLPAESRMSELLCSVLKVSTAV